MGRSCGLRPRARRTTGAGAADDGRSVGSSRPQPHKSSRSGGSAVQRMVTEYMLLEVPPRTVAILVVGNEILSGKIQDTNVRFLAGELYALGAELKRVVVVPDEIDTIAAAVTDLARAH